MRTRPLARDHLVRMSSRAGLYKLCGSFKCFIHQLLVHVLAGRDGGCIEMLRCNHIRAHWCEARQ